jgi:hypothetical protein
MEHAVKSRIFFHIIPLALALAACAGEDAAPEVPMVQPGTTTRPLGPLHFQNSAGGDSNFVGEPFTYTTCTMAREAGSVALVEFTGEGQLIPLREDCTGPYSGDVRVMPSQVYGVAAGEALPAQVPLVYHGGIGLGGAIPRRGLTLRRLRPRLSRVAALRATPWRWH